MTFRIRLAIAGDAPAVHAIYTPIVEQTIISFELTPPSVKEIGQRIETTTAQFPWLVCETNGEVTGYAYASQHNVRLAYQWAVNVSAYVQAQWRGHGIGRGLYEALFALLRAQGYYGAYAGITLPNPASVALHESVGFTPLGVYRAVGYKHGAWHDVGWWECELHQRVRDPAPPIPIGQIVDSSDWNAAIAAGLRMMRGT